MVVTAKPIEQKTTFQALLKEFPRAEAIQPGGLNASSRVSTSFVIANITTGLTIVLHDAKAKVVGVAYSMLPDSAFNPGLSQQLESSGAALQGCYVDVAIPELWKRMENLKAKPETTRAILIGGSQLFTFGGGGGNPLNVGSRNAIMARTLLSRHGLQIVHTSVGGNKARNMLFTLAYNSVYIETKGAEIIKV